MAAFLAFISNQETLPFLKKLGSVQKDCLNFGPEDVMAENLLRRRILAERMEGKFVLSGRSDIYWHNCTHIGTAMLYLWLWPWGMDGAGKIVFLISGMAWVRLVLLTGRILW